MPRKLHPLPFMIGTFGTDLAPLRGPTPPPRPDRSCILIHGATRLIEPPASRGRTRPPRSGARPAAPSGRGERALLAGIRARAAVTPGSHLRLGIGDDCALIAVKAGEQIAVTTDLSIAGRHFDLAWHPPEIIGHRALARGLSDLAAMGARPVAAFLSLGLPPELIAARGNPGRAWIDRFFDGFLALARQFSTPLAGGDLAQSPVPAADVVLLGAVRRGKALLRSAARPGDMIYVTGALGGAAAGLTRLREFAQNRPATQNPAPRIPLKLRAAGAPHLCPQPRVAQAAWLAKRSLAAAAIDLSDGLSTDLRHLCDESGVAAEIDARALPIAAGAAFDEALNGGEDYELLFTARPGARIPRSIAGVKITKIGRVRSRSALKPIVTLLSGQRREAVEPRGWEHFR